MTKITSNVCEHAQRSIAWGQYTACRAGVIACIFGIFLSVSLSQNALASPVRINASASFVVSVNVRQGSRMVDKDVTCYKNLPGTTSRKGGRVIFTSLADKLSALAKAGQKNSRGYRDLSALNKAGRAACSEPPGGSLKAYTGAFGITEAEILMDRFGFGGDAQRAAELAHLGLSRAISELTTFRSEPGLEAQVADLTCDHIFARDPFNGSTNNSNRTCNPYHPNDFDTGGLRYALLWQYVYSQNSFFHKLALFLHDERMAVSSNAADGNERHAVKEYVDLLYRAALSGDYKQYMRDFNSDLLGNLEWLDGATNRGYAPNENYAREFWELGTVGASDRNGNPNYSTLDIAQAALAHSGWTVYGQNQTIPGASSPQYIKYAAFAPAFHAAGAKTIFRGTPYQATVDTAEDLLTATFNHPRTAESLAEDLCKEYISGDCSDGLVGRLANIIRTNNFNLIKTLKTVMASRAMFAPANRKTLIKHPIDLLVGFLRQTKIPLRIDEIDSILGSLDQRPLLPETVFGWNEVKLAGEPYVLPWRNALLNFMTWSASGYQSDRAFNFHDAFLTGIPTDGNSASSTVDRISSMLGIPLSNQQKDALVTYLNFNRTRCQSYMVSTYNCTVNEMFLQRNIFDPYTTGNWESKLKGLITIVAMLPDYRMK